jgi:4-amino-4-deoxy-L-arabinose transferase-like glycosyltransferase
LPNRAALRYSLILLALLIAVQIGVNALWLTTNVVTVGMDRMFHQVTSLAYDHILRQGVSLQSLFTALTWSDYYPPLVHMTVAGFYQMLGVSMDVAAMANSLYLALLLLAVYGIGERLAGQGPWVGLLSAFLVSLLPMIFAMSRYLYLDFALTAMVAANICLLLRSDRFQRRGYALLYGLSLGLGLLVKWTFVVFVAGPLLLVLLRRDTLVAAWQAARSGLTLRDGGLAGAKRLAVAALLGLAVTGLWFVPNVQATAALTLGYGLVPLSWLMWTFTWLFVLAPSSRGSNLLAALGLGACVASGWYLTKINFLPAFYANAYGKPSGRSWGFGQYFDLIVSEQVSPVLAILVLAAVVWLVVDRYRRTRSWRAVLKIGLDGWVLILWVAVSFVVMSSQVSIIHSRYVMPLLPPLGIILALGLSRIPGRRLRAVAIAAVAAFALLQFAALSSDTVARYLSYPSWQMGDDETDQEQPAVSFFARGYSLQQPASGPTDPGYWVVPDILQYIEEQRDSEPAQLGILVNTQQVNPKPFEYLVYSDYPLIQIQELIPQGRGNNLYAQLFGADYLLLIDPSPAYDRRPEVRETLERLLGTEDDTFHRSYDLARTYPLPNGSRLLLYKRHFPRPAGVDLTSYQALMTDLNKGALPGDAVLVAPPEQIYALEGYADPSLRLTPLPSEPRSVSQADLDSLTGLAQQNSRLWLVQGDVGASDPSGLLAGWLADNAYPAGQTWYGPLQLLLYAPTGGQECIPQSTQQVWKDQITLLGYCLVDDTLPLGQIARIDLLWGPTAPVGERYKVFVHVVNDQGVVVSQHDGEPAAGTRPTDTWQPGDEVADRHGLLLPTDLPSGDYQIVAGLYPAEGGDRLPSCGADSSGSTSCADTFTLAHVHVEDGVASVVLP